MNVAFHRDCEITHIAYFKSFTERGTLCSISFHNKRNHTSQSRVFLSCPEFTPQNVLAELEPRVVWAGVHTAGVKTLANKTDVKTVN